MYKTLLNATKITENIEIKMAGDFYEQLAQMPLLLKNADPSAALLTYHSPEGSDVATFKMKLLSEKENKQLNDVIALMSGELGISIQNAYNPIRATASRLLEMTGDTANILVGTPQTISLAEVLQRRNNYIEWLLRYEDADASQQLPFDVDQFLVSLPSTERLKSWKRRMRTINSQPKPIQYVILRSLYAFYESNRSTEWITTLRKHVISSMRERLLDDGNISYVDYLYKSATLDNYKREFEEKYDTERDALLLYTIRLFDIEDEALVQYFDSSHENHRVNYPLVKDVIVPTYKTQYEIATTDDSDGEVYVADGLTQTEYIFKQPSLQNSSCGSGHQLVDKVNFASCAIWSILNLSRSLFIVPLTTFMTLKQKTFKGFLDITSPELANVLHFIKHTSKKKMALNPNVLYQKLANSEEYDEIKRIVKSINVTKSSRSKMHVPPPMPPGEELPMPMPPGGEMPPLDNPIIFNGSESDITQLLKYDIFIQLLGDLNFVSFLSIPNKTKSYNDQTLQRATKYSGSPLIEGRYVAVLRDEPIESDVSSYITYMNELATRLLQKESGFLSTFIQLLKTIEVSVEMLLTTFFTTGKIGIKWLAPLLSIPLPAASPFILTAKYFTDIFIYNYASPKIITLIILELLVLPLELLAKTVASYGAILLDSCEILLVGLRGRIRMLWNDVAKEMLVFLVKFDGGHPTEDNFLFEKHSLNGIPYYGAMSYHLDLESSTQLVLSQFYSDRQKEEEIEMRTLLDTQLKSLKGILREKNAEIRKYLSTKYPNFSLEQTIKSETYMNKTLQLSSNIISEQTPQIIRRPHEELIRRYPRGTLALFPFEQELVDAVVKSCKVPIENTDAKQAIRDLNILMGSSSIIEDIQDIVFGPDELKRYDSSVTLDTNVSLRKPVSDLFISEIVDALERIHDL